MASDVPPSAPAEAPLAALHDVLTGARSVEEACRHHRISREQYQAWADRYWQASLARRNGPDPAAVEFILGLGQALHRYGASAGRLEGAMTLIAQRLGLEGRFFSTPTAIMASFGPVSAEATCLERVQPGELNLEKLALLNEVTNHLVAGTLTLEAATAEVAAIVRAPRRYSLGVTVLSYGLASATSAVFFSGGALEIAVAGGVGLVVGGIAQATYGAGEAARITEPLAATAAALLTACAAQWVGPISPYVTPLAGIITLLPGLGLTTAMTELASRHLASGTARFAGACVQLTGLGFGVAVGTTIGSRLWPVPAPIPLPESWPFPMLAASVVVASLAFAILLRVRPRDLGWVLASGALAFGGARAGMSWIGPELGALVGAFLVATASNAYARFLNRAAAILVVPGLLLLVPGSLGMRGFFALFENDAVSGVAAAFQMILVATSLVAGILLANVVLPPRRPL